jgi:hypothetical protein
MKRFNSNILTTIAMVAVLFSSSLFAQSRSQENEARAVVAKTGIGEKARVELELNNGTKIKGNIESVSADAFTVATKDSGNIQTIAFADVRKIKNPRSGLKPRTWIIIGAAAAAAIIVGKTVLYPVLCDGGAGC